ncbi:MAG: cytochrome P450 [Rhodobacteraceae bacterium]|nr:cytochrome P450 [Paracoccaceae bacterium]
MLLSSAVAPKNPLKVDHAAFRPDPHVGFAQYRPLSGVIEFEPGLPFITRHKDVTALMTDPRTRQFETESLTLRGVNSGALYDFFANSMLVSNPPVHAKRRAPAAKAFAFKAIEAWRPRIRTLVAEILETARQNEEFDFVKGVAAQLPSRLIAQMLGAPEADAPFFSGHVNIMTRALGSFRMEDYPKLEASAAALHDYVRGALEQRRLHPSDDFLSTYLQRVDADGDLTPMETVMQILTIIIGGSDTTRFALTMMVAHLQQNRRQWDALCADPKLAEGAVRETLRYDPPVGGIGRTTIAPLEIDGVTLPAGTPLTLSMLSAQRDAAIYARPDEFDISRTDHPKWSVSLGLGIHRCLGEALARAELEEALIALTQHLPNLRLTDTPPVPKGHSGVRGVSSMRVAIA